MLTFSRSNFSAAMRVALVGCTGTIDGRADNQTGKGGGSATGDGVVTSQDPGKQNVPEITNIADTQLPCVVATLLQKNCLPCHRSNPLPEVPSALVTRSDLLRASMTEPTRSVVELALIRMRDTANPMPPGGATPEQISVLQGWVDAGKPEGTCVENPPEPDPYAGPVVCTSGAFATGGERETPREDMYPGRVCVECHREKREGTLFSIAGTAYPTPHEPNDCKSSGVPSGAYVEITGADRRVIRIPIRPLGNFFYEDAVAMPYKAKVVAGGRERAMLTPQTSGDCNSCHTQEGTMKAPARILLP